MRLSAPDSTRIAKALADAQRCLILEKIARASELSCSDVCGIFPLSQATVSHHLKELVGAHLLDRRKDGQFAYFRFRADVMTAYLSGVGQRMGLARKRSA